MDVRVLQTYLSWLIGYISKLIVRSDNRHRPMRPTNTTQKPEGHSRASDRGRTWSRSDRSRCSTTDRGRTWITRTHCPWLMSSCEQLQTFKPGSTAVWQLAQLRCKRAPWSASYDVDCWCGCSCRHSQLRRRNGRHHRCRHLLRHI